ncbi:hypothetical protein YSY43_24790 [Paenibacillus sp. YSY-4.3]
MKKRLYDMFIKKDEENGAEEIKLFNLLKAICVIWIVSGIVLFFLPDRGTIGDMFGSINTLFSGLAFGGIIYTIYQQRAEFRLQREELQLQREEVAKTNLAMNEQVKAANIQRFENTFFQMIGLHNDIIRSTVCDNKEGREVFLLHYEALKIEIKNTIIRAQGKFFYTDEHLFLRRCNFIISACDNFFKDREHYLGHYLRNLYNLFRMIDKNEWVAGTNEKKEYTRIVRSQLSAFEYIILFYNCFQKKGYKFKYYADKYELFDNMDESLLFDKIDIVLYREQLGK